MKGSKRRTAILASAAPIFNRQGYAGTSIGAILQATELEKGGLYNHFSSKEELAVEAFEYAWREVNRYFARSLAGVASGAPTLHAYVDAFAKYVQRPVVDGGCPLANSALDADDTLPVLSERVRSAYAQVRSFVRHHVCRAVERAELSPSLDPGATADFAIAALQGSIVLARGGGSSATAQNVAKLLHAWLRSLEVSS